jgi:hypothetical protein
MAISKECLLDHEEEVIQTQVRLPSNIITSPITEIQRQKTHYIFIRLLNF